MKILIFGMCNIGKSTVGEFLARKIGYDFIDMDAKIKEKYGTMLGFQDEYNDQYERDELRGIVNAEKLTEVILDQRK